MPGRDGPERRLFGIIRDLAHVRTDEPVTLSSGRRSRHYFDMRRVAGDPEGLALLGEVLHGRIAAAGGAASVGGLESGSIALAAAVSLHSRGAGRAIPSFFVRKAAKAHGMGRRIEGEARSPAAVVDDVVTTGGSALEAVACLRAAGLEAGLVLAPVYRGDAGQLAGIESGHGVRLEYVFSESDFGAD